MGNRIKVEGELDENALKERYERCSDAIEKERWRVVWLIRKGLKTDEVSAVTAFNVRRVRRIVASYNEHGPQALRDQRHTNPGNPLRLTESQQRQLDQALQRPPQDGGVWDGPKVAAWIQDKTGQRTSRSSGWRYLKRLDYSLQLPRRAHTQADQQAQDIFKKNFLSE